MQLHPPHSITNCIKAVTSPMGFEELPRGVLTNCLCLILSFQHTANIPRNLRHSPGNVVVVLRPDQLEDRCTSDPQKDPVCYSNISIWATADNGVCIHLYVYTFFLTHAQHLSNAFTVRVFCILHTLLLNHNQHAMYFVQCIS